MQLSQKKFIFTRSLQTPIAMDFIGGTSGTIVTQEARLIEAVIALNSVEKKKIASNF